MHTNEHSTKLFKYSKAKITECLMICFRSNVANTHSNICEIYMNGWELNVSCNKSNGFIEAQLIRRKIDLFKVHHRRVNFSKWNQRITITSIRRVSFQKITFSKCYILIVFLPRCCILFILVAFICVANRGLVIILAHSYE